MSNKNEHNSNNKRTNLIVNYLPQSMSDEHFRVIFAKYGDLRSARIIRNKTTGYSYGFGFVEYFNEEEADRAIESLNGSVINHKKIKVSHARPSGDEIKNANLYVVNLPPNFDEQDVRLLFEPYGEIIQCRLLGNRVGSAFVLFNLHEQARNAMKELNQQLIEGTSHRISIKFATNEQKKSFRQDKPHVNYNSDDKNMIKMQKPEYFSKNNQHFDAPRSKYQQSHSGKMSGPMRNTTHHNRFNPISQHQSQFQHSSPVAGDELYSGSSYMKYNSMRSNDYYNQSVSGHHSHRQQPHHPQHSSTNPNEMDPDEHVLFVYNIGQDTNEFYLGKLFAYYGPVLRVNVIRRGNSGETRGYGFVTMKYYQDAVNAISALNGYKFANNKPLQVSFKKM